LKKKQKKAQEGKKSTRSSIAEIPTPSYLKCIRKEEKKSGQSTFSSNQSTRLT
jgi:hypothetical protein